ncbi:MAG: 23S rRNA (pseudouridine(1915)-N(3))-methyltransferase RlmH [Clostridiales bacterium]|nr:23S rRNA (pseudouridine(1915)-N(3))-methyltransferase RlmH [Clostridiales bacterium]MCF8022505.1 23S rRNA (pseudouridine(1915)-N(3))-methyltransferase RlmH [Clostridiales bacterium]
MQIVILAVGKLKKEYLLEAQNDYVKRLKPYARIEIKELPGKNLQEKHNHSIAQKIKQKEGQNILKKIKESSYVIVLDRYGEEINSNEMSTKINKLGVGGKSHITFIIGGSLGLSAEVLDRADWKLSFSKLTFPYQLTRIILLEQVYRSFKIIKGETYHK